MKKALLLIFIIYGFTLFSQEKKVKKPEYVVIANDEIISREKLTELGQRGFIKGMNKGVTERKRNELVKKLGNKIGDREFIIMIDLFTEEEKAKHKSKAVLSSKKTIKEKKHDDELKLNINDIAREFTVRMIDGEEVILSKLKGKVILVNYWATWCAPCLMEFSEFPEKILRPYKNEDFVLIAISIGESKEKVEQKMKKMKKYGIDFNVGIDPKKQIWAKYATGTIPKSFLIDKNGIIKYISIGNADGNVDKLSTEIKKLLKE